MFRKVWRLDYVWPSAIFGVATYDATRGWWSEAAAVWGIAALAFAAFYWLRRSATTVELVPPPTFEEGELAVLNEPRPSIKETLDRHVAGCEQCTAFQESRDG